MGGFSAAEARGLTIGGELTISVALCHAIDIQPGSGDDVPRVRAAR
jgi:hypothetical protein